MRLFLAKNSKKTNQRSVCRFFFDCRRHAHHQGTRGEHREHKKRTQQDIVAEANAQSERKDSRVRIMPYQRRTKKRKQCVIGLQETKLAHVRSAFSNLARRPRRQASSAPFRCVLQHTRTSRLHKSSFCVCVGGGSFYYFFLLDQRTPMLKVERKGAAHAQKRVKKNAQIDQKKGKKPLRNSDDRSPCVYRKKKIFCFTNEAVFAVVIACVFAPTSPFGLPVGLCRGSTAGINRTNAR